MTHTAAFAILLVALATSACAADSDDAISDTVPPVVSPVATAPTSGAPTDVPTIAPNTTTTATDPTSDPGPPTPRIGDAVVELEEPVDLAVRPGDDTLYLVERVGRVTAWRDGDSVTVLDITDDTIPEGEQGLLGLAFSADGGLAWINYTDRDGDTVVAEYAVDDDGRFDTDRRRTVLTIDQPHSNHNGGDLALGPDGLLYIGTGDGGSANDPDRRALDLGDLLGKMLRIDPSPNDDLPYTVPSDNPFVDTSGARAEVWSIGLRNPWRFGFDPDTGDLWIADVGQGDVEEIDVLPADPSGLGAGRGASLGWSAFEGDRRANDDQSADGHVAPVHVYTHDDGRCSVSGGAVYRGTAVTGLDGWYLFGDWCTGEVWALDVERGPDGTSAGEIIDVGVVPAVVNIAPGPDGELWALSLDGGVHPILD